MAQTRNTIELLTKILVENGASKVMAETFRLAKFNHKDAVAPMWKLLFELVYYCEFGKIDHVSVKAFGELSTEELVIYVKRELQTRGFYSKEFASLPADMSSGSREVLLALGWLLCKENVIARFIQNCTTPIEDDTKTLHENDVADASSRRDRPEDSSKDDMYIKVQQLLMLNNKLRLSLRNLYALQRENTLLKHEIHKTTYGVVSGSSDKKHLSEMEVYMLRHPQLLKNNLDLLDQDNQRLQNLLMWRDYEDHFWKWMGSVLDVKLQSVRDPGYSDAVAVPGREELPPVELPDMINGAPSSEPGSCDDFVSAQDLGAGDGHLQGSIQLPEADLYTRLSQSHLTLHEAIVKYEAVVEHLENIWEQQSSEITDEDLDSVLSSIDQELSVQRANIMLRNCHLYSENGAPEDGTWKDSYIPVNPASQQRDPEFIYDGKPQNKPQSKGSSLTSTSQSEQDVPDIRHIEEEIDSLNKLVEHLQQEVSEKQSHFKNEMQILSTKFQDAICISPLKPKF